MSRPAHGVTLVELLVAIVLVGILSASLYRVMVANQRAYRWQTHRIELNDNLRAVVTMLPGELRQLSANDPAGSDIIAMSESAIRYKAMRAMHVTCQPVPSGRTTLVLDPVFFGLRAVDHERDSVLIYTGDIWVRRNVVAERGGTGCPGGTRSLDVTIAPGLELADTLPRGSPVRAFELAEIREYTDAAGDRWLGARTYHKSSGWSDQQPFAGPLVVRGLRLAYLDAAGAPATTAGQVARIDVTVIGRSTQKVRTGAGPAAFLTDTLVTSVALRNNQ